mmetsp:Transcript_44060/g.82390  ORF Transcript_44060/g.82390 Transcript_44060/m.82390 type:complete len:138 (+) Transcript_44060:675-1088(+)
MQEKASRGRGRGRGGKEQRRKRASNSSDAETEVSSDKSQAKVRKASLKRKAAGQAKDKSENAAPKDRYVPKAASKKLRVKASDSKPTKSLPADSARLTVGEEVPKEEAVPRPQRRKWNDTVTALWPDSELICPAEGY